MFRKSYTNLYIISSSSICMRKEAETLISKHPELISDAGLFRVLLLPIQLFTLKYMIVEKFRPINIREVYTLSIEMCFLSAVDREYMFESLPVSRDMISQLAGSGYGLGYIEKKHASEILRTTGKKLLGLSETKKVETYVKELKKMNVKFPSYDKFKGVFEAFEDLGILIKRGKEGKGITYGVVPEFYNSFKDKTEEILKL